MTGGSGAVSVPGPDGVRDDRSGWSRRTIRAARPDHPRPDAWSPIGHSWEWERGTRVVRRRALTVFLAGAECPFTCLFCDLWKYTIDGPTPAGALPRQLAESLTAAGEIPPGSALKLYNASNFFDERAVPAADHERLAALARPFERITVECHPRLVGDGAARFSERLVGRLELAMGLETCHPDVFPRLDKGMTLDDFETAVDRARERGLGTRVFVLVGLPWVPPSEFATWAARTVAHAAGLGVDRVGLIPLRRGNGALDELARRGRLDPTSLEHLEQALERSLETSTDGPIVEADLWDVDRLPACPACREARLARLRRMNLEQTSAPPVVCGCRP